MFLVQCLCLCLSLSLYIYVSVSVYGCFYLDPLGMGVGFPATHLRPWNVYFAG